MADAAVVLARTILLFLLTLASECLGGSRYCSSYRDQYGVYKYGFYCPRLFESSSKRYCCGTYNHKYCCSSYSYYGGYSGYTSIGLIGGVISGMICLSIIVALLVCCFCAACPLYKRRHYGRVIAAPGMTTTTVTTGAVPVSYTQASGTVLMANPQPPPYAPAYPPPAYHPTVNGMTNTVTTTTSNGYASYYR